MRAGATFAVGICLLASSGACTYRPVQLAAGGDSDATGDANTSGGGDSAGDHTRWANPDWFPFGESTVLIDSGSVPVGSATGHGVFRTGEATSSPSVLVDPDGNPIVAYERAGPAVDVVWYRGGGLRGIIGTVGDGADPPAYQPRLSWMPSEELLLAWKSEGTVHVKSYANLVWTNRGALGASAVATSLLVEDYDAVWSPADDTVIVAMAEATGSTKPLNLWLADGAISLSRNGGEVGHPSLAVFQDATYLAWDEQISAGSERRIYVMRYNGVSWEDVGGAATDDDGVGGRLSIVGDASHPSLSAAEHYLHLAWRQQTASNEWEVLAASYQVDGSWQVAGHDLLGGGIGGLSAQAGISGEPITAATTASDNQNRVQAIWLEEDGGMHGRRAYRRDGESEWFLGSMFGALDATALFLNRPGTARRPAMALWNTNDTVVAWTQEVQGRDSVYLARWRCGALWEEISPEAGGGISATEECSEVPTIVLDESRVPIVAWQERAGERTWDIHIKQYDGSAWIGIANPSGDDNLTHNSNPVSAAFPHAAIADDGTLFLSWYEWVDDSFELFVMRRDGASWTSVDGDAQGRITDSGTSLTNPRIALNADGQPVIGYIEGMFDGLDTRVIEFDGTAWQPRGGRINTSGKLNSRHDIAVGQDGNIYIAYAEYNAGSDTTNLWVKRFDRALNQWVGVGPAGGNIAPFPGTPHRPSITTFMDTEQEPGNEIVHVAWRHEIPTAGSITHEVRYVHWHRNEWRGANHGPAYDVIAGGNGSPRDAEILVTDAGEPVIAWADMASGGWNIRVKAWDNNWFSVGGAAEGLGLSGTHTPSRYPSLAYRDGRLCAAWTGNGVDSLQVETLCYDIE